MLLAHPHRCALYDVMSSTHAKPCAPALRIRQGCTTVLTASSTLQCFTQKKSTRYITPGMLQRLLVTQQAMHHRRSFTETKAAYLCKGDMRIQLAVPGVSHARQAGPWDGHHSGNGNPLNALRTRITPFKRVPKFRQAALGKRCTSSSQATPGKAGEHRLGAADGGQVQRLILHAGAGGAVPVPWQHRLRQLLKRRVAVALDGREQHRGRRVVLQQGDQQIRRVPAPATRLSFWRAHPRSAAVRVSLRSLPEQRSRCHALMHSTKGTDFSPHVAKSVNERLHGLLNLL